MLEFDSHKLAWAAGFADGEANFMLSDGYYKQAIVQIAQVRKGVLIKFRNAVKVGRITGPYAPKNCWHSLVYHYRAVSFEEFQHVVAVLWKYLSKVKRAQASDVLIRYRDYSSTVSRCVRLTKLQKDILDEGIHAGITHRVLAEKVGVSRTAVTYYKKVNFNRIFSLELSNACNF